MAGRNDGGGVRGLSAVGGRRCSPAVAVHIEGTTCGVGKAGSERVWSLNVSVTSVYDRDDGGGTLGLADYFIIYIYTKGKNVIS